MNSARFTVTGEGHRVEYVLAGSGRPVTVFAHGIASSIDETRPLGGGVAGTRAYFHFRGHGGSAAPESPWTYPALAAELRAVADEVGATRALGVSLGAAALAHLLVAEPGRFERVVFFLPGVFDRPRADDAELRTYRDLLARGDPDGGVAALTEHLLGGQPAAVRAHPESGRWARRQAERLAGPELTRAARELAAQVPVPDPGRLAEVRAPALVVAQRHDPAHPVDVAARLAAALPAGRLHVFTAGAALWLERRALRALLTGFLGPAGGSQGAGDVAGQGSGVHPGAGGGRG